MKTLVVADQPYLNQYLATRPGECKVGEQLQLLPQGELSGGLAKLAKKGIRFVLLGVPEDIGPRANLGRGGADKGWAAFLSRFVNLQQNDFIRANEIALLGHIHCDDLQQQSKSLELNNDDDLATIRQHVGTLDQRLAPVIKTIVEQGLYPIVIGGGHNNAFPILQGTSQAKGTAISAINLDPHTDFRALEGRHSGNGFNYAAEQGYLGRYFSLGMHELKNSAANIASLNSKHFPFISYQQIYVRREMTLAQALQDAQCYLSDGNKPIGVELDVDSISFMPASAYTNAGVDLADAQFYVHAMASIEQSCYLHLAEGAPIQHPAGIDAGNSDVGQGLSALVASFIQAKQEIGE
ncbi:formimidoylglutamase [Psychrobium sp. 1_MG-2023]|uniref:formimidoylglutamase n=1 Tax=Psychrobium sp. 1_MG-2023 TaxID=3062624 RepID=UPI000C339898|nr:formimidoylglutamase [Psychrobium sp. 1_MG-2023]MDP2562522.1 formimidoylglutamase [Psychrobium sp. 1_MG-2023]PKF57986.1 arginase [Alteromonadales bacterium alter-6D02]